MGVLGRLFGRKDVSDYAADLRREAAEATVSKRPVDAAAAVQAAVTAGHLIEAIKIYRAAHGVSLVEAKDAIDALAKGERPPPPTGAPVTTPAVRDNPRVAELWRSGNKIAAIKEYREVHGVGLAEAKEAVEDMMRADGSSW